MSRPTIAVLLATYNGEKYLVEQLNSIICQKEVNVHIYISDDGSSDKTIYIIKSFIKKYPKKIKKFFCSKYKNAAKNFMSFTKKKLNYKYYAYCDQDDVWLERKLINALKKINLGYDLYGGRTINTDKNLNIIGKSPNFNILQSYFNFSNALIQSFAGGNTMVFTHKIYKLLEKTDLKKTIVAHDWWTYIIATYCGKKVYYDQVPYILYRQHGKNINGHNLGLRNQIVRIYKALKGEYKKWINYNLVLLRDFDKYGVKKNKVLIKKFFQLRKKNIKLLNPIKIPFFRKEIFGQLKLKLGLFLKKV
jgi:glycosyltransferase involved in cell wall biosynthesis